MPPLWLTYIVEKGKTLNKQTLRVKGKMLLGKQLGNILGTWGKHEWGKKIIEKILEI
jgi:hypothetical protein